jgi:hypothetical protein
VTYRRGALARLRRVGTKFFFRQGEDVPLIDFIPVFHRWIQTDAVDGTLIDVADYSHVPEGPGIILVSHESVYSVDERNGRRGISCARRSPVDPTLQQALGQTARAAAGACVLLEKEFSGRIRFSGGEVEFFANDRLLAPNSAEAFLDFEPYLDSVLATMFPGVSCQRTREPDPRERLAVLVEAPHDLAFADLAGRIRR